MRAEKFVVQDKYGPLREGELDRARAWGERLQAMGSALATAASLLVAGHPTKRLAWGPRVPPRPGSDPGPGRVLSDVPALVTVVPVGRAARH